MQRTCRGADKEKHGRRGNKQEQIEESVGAGKYPGVDKGKRRRRGNTQEQIEESINAGKHTGIYEHRTWEYQQEKYRE